MDRPSVKALFLEALEKICATENSPIRFPFNVSKVNDTMRGINPTYHVSNTPYSKFVNLITDMEKGGHCKSSRENDSVVFVDIKGAPALMRVPYTAEEKAEMKRVKEVAMAAKRAEREAEVAAAAEAEAAEAESNTNQTMEEENDAGADDSPSGDPIDDEEEGEVAANEVEDDERRSSVSRSRSRSRSRERRRNRSD